MKSAKEISLILIGLIGVAACSSKKDPIPASCQTNSVTVFNKSFSRFSFTKDTNGKEILNDVKVYDGTDSAYTYTYSYAGGALSQIVQTGVGSKKSGLSKTYVVSFNGTKISKISAQGKDETRLTYSGDQVSQSQGYAANSAGTMFQISHSVYTYDASGNLVKSETYLDLAAFFTIAFGANPTSYNPILFATTTYEPSTSINPLNGDFYMDQQDLFVMKNMSQKTTFKDLTGKVTSTDTYVITNDSNGLPTKATAGSKYTEATYVCE